MTIPFDPTGKSLYNKIIGESKSVSLIPGRTHLFVVPLKGPFFSESLVIKYTPVSGAERVLTEGVDYALGFQFAEATRRVNAPIYAAIEFNDLTLNGSVTYSYQSIGSDYETSSVTIASIESTSLADPVFTTWESVTSMPIVPVVDFPWTSVNITNVQRAVEELAKVGIVAHLRPAFLPEPDETVFVPTAQEVGLGQVPNYPPATLQQALDGTSDASLMTPVKTAAAVQAEVIRQLADIGYLVPVDYAGGINITNSKFTVNVDDEVYVIKDSSLPHTTSGVWSTDSVHFDLFQNAKKEKWVKTYVTVAGTESTNPLLGKIFNIDVEHDSRITPQLILNDLTYLQYGVDYKISNDKLYVSFPVGTGDRLVLHTKRSLLSLSRDKAINKVFVVAGGAVTFPLGDIGIDPDNLRVTLNGINVLNAQTSDYSITGSTLTVAYPIANGDVIEVENIDSAVVGGSSGSVSLDSPAFTGVPTAPTAATVTNNTQLATTAFVQNVAATKAATVHTHAAYAPINSPAFTGVPTAPTVSFSTATDQLATTNFVHGLVALSRPSAPGTVQRVVAESTTYKLVDYSNGINVWDATNPAHPTYATATATQAGGARVVHFMDVEGAGEQVVLDINAKIGGVVADLDRALSIYLIPKNNAGYDMSTVATYVISYRSECPVIGSSGNDVYFSRKLVFDAPASETGIFAVGIYLVYRTSPAEYEALDYSVWHADGSVVATVVN